MRILAISNQKGGCGKTTTAVNLSASFAQNGKRVLLIDLDPQAHATLGLNIAAKLSIYNVLSRSTPKKARLEDIITKVSPLLDIAPSSILLGTLEQELADEIGRESILHECLKNFPQNYDYIIVDCPPNLGILTINAIRSCSELIIPVEASRFSFEGLNSLIEIINLVRDRLQHSVKYWILMSLFDSRLRHSFAMLNKIRQLFKNNMFNTIIHVNVKLKEAQAEGVHVLSYDKYSRGAKDFFSLSREIITLHGDKVSEAALEEIKDAAGDKDYEVTFELSAPDARVVNIVGDFNSWVINDASKLIRENGTWKKRVKLDPGEYKYRFVVDGKWMDDPSNPQKRLNPFGEMDSILRHSK